MTDTQQVAQDVAEASAAAMWADDRASQALGMEIVEVGPGRAVLRMTVRDDMVNGHAIGHGGLTFTLADSAFAFACNSYDRRTVAAGAEIRFLAPTRLGDVLTATAVERSREGAHRRVRRRGHRRRDVVATFVGRSHEIGGSFGLGAERTVSWARPDGRAELLADAGGVVLLDQLEHLLGALVVPVHGEVGDRHAAGEPVVAVDAGSSRWRTGRRRRGRSRRRWPRSRRPAMLRFQ